MPIKETIHLVFKTHLDIGFTDLARNVVKTYFEVFIPSAIETAKKLKETGSKDRFIWTTGSWLIYEYLERGTPQQRHALEQAIEAGDIRWHGLPFTTHTELMDKSLFKYGLSLSQQLDKRFGKKTISGKMTDVPGHTRGMVPLVSEAGIQFIHLGANEASTPPDVPPTFVWKDSASNTNVMVMYQKSGYGGLIRVPGLSHTLAFAHTNDNHGAQSPEEVQKIYRDLRQNYPNAEIIASTMDAYATHLLNVKAQLPVVEQEMGDTWVQGVGTDPTKVSRYRELLRLWEHWLENGQVKSDDQKMIAFSNQLMMVPEHTWGMDEKVHLHDYVNYEQKAFQKARSTEPFHKFESSWEEQRAYVDEAVKALADSPVGKEAQKHLKAIQPKLPDIVAYEVVKDTARIIDTPQFEIGFDPETGAINHLFQKQSKRNWASKTQVLGLFRYQTFSQADYDRYWKNYVINKRNTRVWSWDDQTKPGMEIAHPESRFWLPQLINLYTKHDEQTHSFLLKLKLDDEASSKYGGPRLIWIQVDFPTDENSLRFDVQWFEKPATRLPEAVWYSFNPVTRNNGQWLMDKLGSAISPLDIIKDGNRKLHAVERGVTYQDKQNKLEIETLDAPLVAPGEPSLLNFNNKQPNLKNGMHFNLLNNVWGTNFPMWFEDDAHFRFQMVFNASNG